MKKTLQIIVSAALVGSALLAATPAQAFFGPFGGGPWNWFDNGYYGPWGGYPYYGGYPYGGWGGYPYYGGWGGYPYYGVPAYGYAYPYAAPLATASNTTAAAE